MRLSLEPHSLVLPLDTNMDRSWTGTGRKRVELLSRGRVECGTTRQRNRWPEQTVAPPGIANTQRKRTFACLSASLFLPFSATQTEKKVRRNEMKKTLLNRQNLRYVSSLSFRLFIYNKWINVLLKTYF